MSSTLTAARSPSALRDAFFNQYNLILLGGAAAFAGALGSPLPLVGGLAGEALWLLAATQLPPLRAWAARHRDEVARPRTAPVSPVGDGRARPALTTQASLAASAQVAARLAELPELLRKGGHEVGLSLDVKLQGVLAAFQQLQAHHTRASSALALLRAHEISHPLAAIERSLNEAEDAATRMQLRRAFSQAQKRAREAEALTHELTTIGRALDDFETGLAGLTDTARFEPGRLEGALDDLLGVAASINTPFDGARLASAPSPGMRGTPTTASPRTTGTYFSEPDAPT